MIFDIVKANTLIFLYFFGLFFSSIFFIFFIKELLPGTGGKLLTSNHHDFSEHFVGYTSDRTVVEFLEERFRKRVESQLENGKIKLVVLVDEPKDSILQSLRKKTQEHVQMEQRDLVLNAVI